MKIAIASPEVVPFAKTGGLADVAGALPKYLARLGANVKVFMPFYRTEEVRLKKVEGVGLGLSVTRSMVEMHRGKIWVESEPGKGSTFKFTLQDTPKING